MQRSVDDDLLVLSKRRAALQAREEALAAKEQAQGADRSLLEKQLSATQQRLAKLEQAAAAAAAVPAAPAATPVTESEADKERRRQRMAELLAAGAGAPPVPAGHAHRPHATVAAPAARPGFALDAAAAAPPFLEPLAREWGFARDAKQDLGFLTLMPWPKSVVFERRFVRGRQRTLPVHWSDQSDFARAAVARFEARLAALWEAGALASCPHGAQCGWGEVHQKHLFFLFSHTLFQTAVELRVNVSCERPGPAVPSLAVKEQYTLEVGADGQVQIGAAEGTGVLRALATLLQLATRRGEELFLPQVVVRDEPVYAWRGVMLDVARNFHPVENVLSLLEGMEAVKLNVLHWHLSDDQGFRLEVRALPELHRRAAGGEFYTHEQVEAVVRAAALRGIRVVPEIDMPAHVGAILLAYPALAWGAAPSAPDTQWGVRPWVLDPSRPELYAWLAKLLDEVAALFPDEYYHIGGDEVPPAAWQVRTSCPSLLSHSLYRAAELLGRRGWLPTGSGRSTTCSCTLTGGSWSCWQNESAKWWAGTKSRWTGCPRA